MECITWFAPILPGKLDQWKSLLEEINGPRKDDHLRFLEQLGLTREAVSLMQTPQGDFACLFHEGEDLARSYAAGAATDDTYGRWFMDQLTDVHGITAEMRSGPLPATLMFDSKAG